MKKIQFCLLFVLIFASFSAFSQSKITKKTTKSKAKTEKNTINLKERLWYGGSISLGGGSSSLDQFTPGNIFIIKVFSSGLQLWRIWQIKIFKCTFPSCRV